MTKSCMNCKYGGISITEDPCNECKIINGEREYDKWDSINPEVKENMYKEQLNEAIQELIKLGYNIDDIKIYTLKCYIFNKGE